MLLLIIVIVFSSLVLVGCDKEWWNKIPNNGFISKWKTTEDGFSYYVDDEIGLCIMAFPLKEEITIPEYIDGMRVVQLGCQTEPSLGHDGKYGVSSSVKKLTIQHKMSFFCNDFPQLETITFVDCWYEYADILSREKNTLTVYTWNYTRSGRVPIHPNVELVKGNKEVNLHTLDVSTIEIRNCVTRIDAGLFNGLENVTIKTSLVSKPEGWAEDWNGSCEIEWNAAINECNEIHGEKK